jgi:predicted HTH domain antitoxin
MAKTTVRLDVPKAVAADKKLKAAYLDAAEQALKEQAVLRLFEQGAISSGYGAELLGMTRYDFMLLLGKRGIPYFNYTEEEWQEELKNVERERKRLSAAKMKRRKT